MLASGNPQFKPLLGKRLTTRHLKSNERKNTFDKTRAMRNAERFVAQGKLKAAIGEYRSVVEHDPKDISTTNMLGDLLAKNADKPAAIDCYRIVAEHYAGQGFAQKAIAVYNKISKLQPKSMEIAEKLAELYAMKGSLSEARQHYTAVAESHSKAGRRLEALAVWKQIALLDPNNTEVCVTLAESYHREGQIEEAADEFAEAAARLTKKGKLDEASKCLSRSLEIRPGNIRVLSLLVDAYSANGQSARAAETLNEILESEPYNRDVLYLLVDTHIRAGDVEQAEKTVVRLVEIEPANYPRLLDLLNLYVERGDVDAAARILSMSCEYLLAAGEGEKCKTFLDEILSRKPDHIATLRLLVRYVTWLKDPEAFRDALERLAMAARASGDFEDEHFALAHLAVVRPFETKYAERLAEIDAEHNFQGQAVDEELLKAQFVADDEPTIGRTEERAAGTAQPTNETTTPQIERNGDVAPMAPPVGFAGEAKLAKELESISFYVENGYEELARKALNEVEAAFGDHAEIAKLRAQLEEGSHAAVSNVDFTPVVAQPSAPPAGLDIEDFRSEFGVEEAAAADSDYDTHFHTAVAYQEMGLIEQAISEFQDAIRFAGNGAGNRRFFDCANLLGHCFMSNGMPKHAVTWFGRALESIELSSEEKQGLWYELALAFEADGDPGTAGQYYEKVYAENVDFRDVAHRLKALMVSH